MTTEERVATAISGAPFPSERSLKNARAAIKEHLATLADDGLVIAPRNPSVAAQDIGNEAIHEEKNAGYVYRAMIAHETEGAEAAMEGDHG